MRDTLGTRSTAAVPNESSISPLAGKPAPKEMLLELACMERNYFERHPDLHNPNQLVSFGTSLNAIVREAQDMVNNALGSSGAGAQPGVDQ